MSRSRSLTAGSLVVALVGACSGGSGGGGGPAHVLSGTLAVSAPPAAVLEAEPNDTIDQSHYLGTISAGQTLTVLGHITASGSDDPFDGFLLSARQRLEITATLRFEDPGTNDFDMYVYDPVGAQFVEAYLAATPPEVGVFHVKGSFHLVLQAYSGAGSYSLTIEAASPASQIAEIEPNTAHGEAQYLGECLAGDSLEIAGHLDENADATDRVLLAFPAATRLEVSLAFIGGPGADFDLVLYDATSDISNPVERVRFESPGDNPETGTYDVPAMTLLEIEALGYSGAGPYVLSLEGTTIVDGERGAGDEHLFGERLAPLGKEYVKRPTRYPEVFFGRPAVPAATGEMIVGPRPGQDAEAELARRGCRVLDRIPGSPGSPGGPWRVGFDLSPRIGDEERARATIGKVQSLASSRALDYCELNSRVQAEGEPNDQFYNLQWHYSLIQLPEAWDTTTGSTAAIVAVIDSGRTDHPDLVSRMIAGYDFISDPDIAGDGDGIDPDPTDVGSGGGTQPSSFHGSHVAGTVGAETDTAGGYGVAGVTWSGRIMPIRVLGIGGGLLWDVGNGIRYAAGLPNTSPSIPPQRAHVINMSLSSASSSVTLQNAVTAARNAGVVIFAAAGNQGGNVVRYPAAMLGVVSVAAVDLNADRAPYSNYHVSVDLAAPGGDTSADLNGDGYVDGVLSTVLDDSVTPARVAFKFYQGTSMATPHAAGLAALMLSVDPTLTPDELEAILFATATDLGAAGHDSSFGHGLINATRAVAAAAGDIPVLPILGVSTLALAFAPGQDELDVHVTNNGGDFLVLDAPVVSTESGGGWLSVVAVAAAPGANTDTAALRVQVDRRGLANGTYQGSIELTSNGGARDLQVSLIASTAPLEPDVDIYVLVIDADTWAPVAEVVVNPSRKTSYGLTELPEGQYLIVAGSDDDGDDVIWGELDLYRGAYPTYDSPERVTKVEGESLVDLDFPVSATFDPGADRPGPGGFRLLVGGD